MFERHSMRRRVLAVAGATALCAALVGTVGASASPRHDAAKAATRPSILRTIRQHQQAAPTALLTYGGGKVQQATNTNYLIFWEPPTLQDGSTAFVSPQYNSLIQQYFNDVGGSGLYNNNTQYYQRHNNVTQNIVNSSTLGGVFVDTAAYPTGGCNDPVTGVNCVTDSALRAEIKKVAQAQHWRVSATSMFYVFQSEGEGSFFNLAGYAFYNYCAYHYNTGKVIYANMPYGATPVSGYPDGVCTTLSQFPNDHDADIEISPASHEQMEAVTDPYPFSGWNSGSGEIGDLCAYNYGPLNYDGGLANELWNGHYYVMQMEWSNQQNTCVQFGP